MIRVTSECSDRGEGEELQRSFEATKGSGCLTLRVLGGSYKSWIENQVRLRA